MPKLSSKCLVLGANGFIGSHLVDALITDGYFVRAFDHYPDTDYKFNMNQNIEIVNGDFLNRDDLSQALKGIDYVFHLISTTTPSTSENDPIIDIETNIKMSVELFQECVQHKIKKVIFPSSGGAIYGLNSSYDTKEETLPAPISPYAIGKLTVEHYLRYFYVKYGLNSLIYRISNPYGERQSVNSRQGVIPIFLRLAKEGKPLTVLGDGSMIRDYIHILDVTRIITATFLDTKDRLYNLGSGKKTSLNELITLIESTTHHKLKIVHSPEPSTFVKEVVLNSDKLLSEFKIKPYIELPEGLTKLWQKMN